jgi:hypothetical protein
VASREQNRSYTPDIAVGEPLSEQLYTRHLNSQPCVSAPLTEREAGLLIRDRALKVVDKEL